MKSAKAFIAVCVAGFLASGAAAAQSKTKRMNVVVVLADDLGWGDLGCYGNDIIKTPNLDQFAKEGTRFTQCYSGSSVCSPSRSAILTGRTPYRNGVFRWIPARSRVHLRRSEITLATLLRQLGYTTCHVGKWHLNGMFNSPKQPQPNDHGFDHWLATQNNAAPSHKNPVNFVRNGKKLGKIEGFSAEIVADEAIDWLKNKRDKSKPFYINMWFHEPHLPIESNPIFMKKYYADFLKSDPDRAQHHANVTQLDHAFGKLMKVLADLNLDENTIVIFTSDNGPEGDGMRRRTRGYTGGLRGRKRSLYEGGIRVPGIVRWPGKTKPGSTSEQPIIGQDIFTTICKFNGIAMPKNRTIDGVDFMPALTGGKIERKIPMYWRCQIAPGPLKVAMRKGDYVILGNREFTMFEMYNLAKDRAQKNDLVKKEPAIFQRMQTVFSQLNREIEAEGPNWWKDDPRYKNKGKKKKKKKKG